MSKVTDCLKESFSYLLVGEEGANFFQQSRRCKHFLSALSALIETESPVDDNSDQGCIYNMGTVSFVTASLSMQLRLNLHGTN